MVDSLACRGGHLVDIVVVLYGMQFNMGCEVPCTLIMGWVEVIYLSYLRGLGDR